MSKGLKSMEKLLLIIGVSIFGALGTIHLLFTFLTQKFNPYNSEAKKAMLETSPKITKETSMWHAWVGFNASHSLGVMLFAAIYIPLSIHHFTIISSSIWLSTLPCIVGGSYLFLAKRYWFKVPFVGIFIALICFVVSACMVNT